MPVDDKLTFICFKIDSVKPEDCNNKQELDQGQELIERTNDEIVNYMQEELKGDKLNDQETVSFISFLLDRIKDLHIRIASRRMEVDDSQYFSQKLYFSEDQEVNGYKLLQVNGDPIFPKEIFVEQARIWMTEPEMTRDQFEEKMEVIREKFSVDGDNETYWNLPYPKQPLIVMMLYSNKIYKKIEPRYVNFFAEWIRQKIEQLGYDAKNKAEEQEDRDKNFHKFVSAI